MRFSNTNLSISISDGIDCSCAHHSATMERTVPWTPKVAPIQRSVPNLLPAAPGQSGTPNNRRTFSGLDHGLLEAQIRINSNIMKKIEELKEDRKKFAALQEKTAKEKEMLAMKYTRANEQLQYMMKKFGKRNDASKENQNPNGNGGSKKNDDGGSGSDKPNDVQPSEPKKMPDDTNQSQDE